MGKKGIKEYTKLCSKYGTKFEGFNVPVGALYGRIFVPYKDILNTYNDYVFWVCTAPKGIKTGVLHVHIMKRTWGRNDSCATRNIIWHEIQVGRNHPIYAEVKKACIELRAIPKIKTCVNPQVKINRKYKDSHTLGLRKAPCPQMNCFKQAMVDGAGYDISWEENVQPMKDSSGYNYNGVPVFNINQANFSPFEGITDTDAFKKRDGMKVNQTKCRPSKTTVDSTIIIKINGVIVNK